MFFQVNELWNLNLCPNPELSNANRPIELYITVFKTSTVLILVGGGMRVINVILVIDIRAAKRAAF
jgi:hypothetical protein